MTLEEIDEVLAQIAPEARKAALELGVDFGSDTTLKQANRTLNACERYGDKVAKRGFSAAKVQRLTWARDAIEAATVGRTGEVVGKKTTTKGLRGSIEKAKTARLEAIALLSSTADDLRELGTDEATTAAATIASTLSQARSTTGVDAKQLGDQLDVLRNALENDATISEATKEDGGPETVAELTKAAQGLRETTAARTTPAGTPQATARLNILDGLIITLCRAARKAGLAAARRFGDPAIAQAFELSDLYDAKGKGTKGGGNDDKDESDGEAGAPEVATTGETG